MDIRNPPGGRDASNGAPEEGRTGKDSDASTHTAFSRLAPRDRHPGEMWGGLRIVDALGRGGFGCVYRAWDATLARDVALKILRLGTTSPAVAADLLAEGRLLARVRHRNVVTVFGAQQIGEEVGLWMELVRGRSLFDIVRQDGPLGAEEAIVVGSGLARALAAVHGAGLVHRDVKANNVMREAGGRIVLMDFGTGRDLAAAARAGRSDLAGTPVYMAPEVLAGRQAAAPADLYSLGVLLFFLVTGRFPVEGRDVTDILLAHGRGRRLLSDLRPDLPDPFVRIVERALSSDPEARYQSAGAMLRDFMEAGGDDRHAGDLFSDVAHGPVAPPPWTPRTSSDAWRHESTATAVSSGPAAGLWRWGAAAAGLLLVVWTLGFLMSVAFDQSLGRTEFSNESPFTWLTWGLRSLVAPAIYALLAIVVLRLALSIWQVLAPFVPPLGRGAATLRERLGRGLSHRLRSPAALGQLLFVLQVGAVLLIWALFSDLIAAFTTYVDTADAAALDPLRPAGETRQNLYRTVLTLLLLVMATAWYHLWVRRPEPERPDRVTFIGGVGVMVIVLLLLELPYRLVYASYFPQVEFAGARCFELGDTPTALLLHCPDSPPRRNTIVQRGDPRVQDLGSFGNLFKPDP